MRTATAGITVLLCLLLGACGFQLRGLAQTPNLDSLALSGGSSQLRFGLEDRLQDMDILVHNEAPYRLVISDEDWNRRTGAVDRQGRQAELELRYQLRWHLEDRHSGAMLSPSQRLVAMRTFAYFPDNATASSDEEQLVRADLYEDLIARLINQLARVSQDLERH